MQGIVRWCLKNKSVVVLATVLLIASGVYATTRLNQELLPDIDFPLVVVSTPVPGASPDVVDEQVTQPVEGAIEGVEGIESVQSTSSQNFSVVVVEFGFEVDTEEAEADINAALEDVSLPEGAGPPEARRQSADSFPIQSISLAAGDGNLEELTRYAEDEAVPLIEEVDGVASADLVGGSERQIEVELDPARLGEQGITADAVVGAISGSNTDAPAGEVRIEGLSTPVRAEAVVTDPEALRDLPVGISGAAPAGAPTGAPPGVPAGVPSGASPPPGAASPAPTAAAPEPVLLGDVAEVGEADANISGISRTNGEPSLSINVTRQPDANTVEVSRGVEEALEEVREDLGRDEVVVVFDSSEDVEASVLGLVEKAAIGGLLAIVVIFGFLRSLRATLVTAVSLPTSILAALLFSWEANLTLNIVTLAGLTIAVGRVVDDAIVVLENAYRYVQQGYDPEEAALRGTTEVASAITSSTLTTVAVFLPLGLVGGIVSRFFLPLSLTVAFALLASLVVAVTIIPVLTALFIGRRSARRAAEKSSEGTQGGTERRRDRRSRGRRGLNRLYVPALRWSLRHRFLTMLAAIAVFAAGFAAIPYLAVSFFPPSEERLLQANVELPSGTTQADTAGELAPFEDFLTQDGGVDNYQLSIGGENSFDPNAPLRGDNQAQAFVLLGENADIQRTLERIRAEGDDLYGDDFQADILAQGPPTGGLEVTITGGTEEELGRASDAVVEELENNGNLTNVESDLTGGSPEIEVAVDEAEASSRGLSPAQISSTLGTLLGGAGAGAPGGVTLGETPVSIGVPEERVDSIGEVENLPLGQGTTVGDVAEVRRVEAPAAVTRADGDRAVTVTGTITSEDTNAVSTEVGETLANLDLPQGVTAQIGGESEDIAESFRNLILSIFVALALVYLILVVFFRSLVVPLIILLSVPLITAGSFGALLVTGTALSLPALLGVLLLIGIVVANAILLVDFAIQARSRHESVNEALVEAGSERLRPILMTAFATIFALLPLALDLSFFVEGGNALISSSLAIPVVGGLVTSTFMTLFVVPVGYSLLRGRRQEKRGVAVVEPRRDDGFDPPPRKEAVEPTPDGLAGHPNGRSGVARGVPEDVAMGPVPGDRQEELLYELGVARGRAEVLEKELSRRKEEP